MAVNPQAIANGKALFKTRRGFIAGFLGFSTMRMLRASTEANSGCVEKRSADCDAGSGFPDRYVSSCDVTSVVPSFPTRELISWARVPETGVIQGEQNSSVLF